MKFFGIVVCFLWVNVLKASTTYRAGVIPNSEMKFEEFESMVVEAGKLNVDILVLPSLGTSESADNYDEIVKTLSTVASDASLYLVAHLYEKSRCHQNVELIRSNLVFDRKGTIDSVYRKPTSKLANCTTPPSDLVAFTTDFGVTFGLLMDEDIVLHNVDYMKGLKNFVMTGASNNLLSASSWSYVNNVNLISSHGIYAGQSEIKKAGGILIADLVKSGVLESVVVPSINSEELFSEDFNEYIIKTLDLEASLQGYKETVCYNTFCCELYAKTGAVDQTVKPLDASYALAVFDGLHELSDQQNIGVQSCILLACAGHKNSCELLPNRSSNVIFEKISITANFTKQTAQYPVIQSTSVLPAEKMQYRISNNGISTQVTLKIVDSQNVIKFGLWGRDYTKDFESLELQRNNSEPSLDLYSCIFNEDIQEFFDYVWIRLRILLVVVSIYFLEMM